MSAAPLRADQSVCAKCGWPLQSCDCCGLCGEPNCDCAKELNGDQSEPLGDGELWDYIEDCGDQFHA